MKTQINNAMKQLQKGMNQFTNSMKQLNNNMKQMNENFQQLKREVREEAIKRNIFSGIFEYTRNNCVKVIYYLDNGNYFLHY